MWRLARVKIGYRVQDATECLNDILEARVVEKMVFEAIRTRDNGACIIARRVTLAIFECDASFTSSD